MDVEERIKALNDAFRPIQEELKQILLDIRVRLMEGQTPIPNDLERRNLEEFLKQKEAEKKEADESQDKLIKQQTLSGSKQ